MPANLSAYFQAVYKHLCPVSYLRPLFLEAIRHQTLLYLSIATRPDCINDEILTLLSELNQIKPVLDRIRAPDNP